MHKLIYILTFTTNPALTFEGPVRFFTPLPVKPGHLIMISSEQDLFKKSTFQNRIQSFAIWSFWSRLDKYSSSNLHHHQLGYI